MEEARAERRAKYSLVPKRNFGTSEREAGWFPSLAYSVGCGTVRKTLLLLEARRLADELGREMAEDRRTGRMTDEKIAEAIREHREQHPYR